jgi:hypothetical protein
MNTVWTIVSIVVVLAGAGLGAYLVYALSPFAHHSDVYHGPEHQRSPRLD